MRRSTSLATAGCLTIGGELATASDQSWRSARIFLERGRQVGLVKSPVSRPVGLALRLALPTGLRAGEVAGITMDEIHNIDDDANAILLISGDRIKNGRDHLVPLSPLALEIVRELKGTSRYLLVSPTRENVPIKAVSLPDAMRHFGERSRARRTSKRAGGISRRRRTTCGARSQTNLSKLGIPREDRDACMNHTRTDVGARYDRYDRPAEKRIAVDKWSMTLAGILAGKPADASGADQTLAAAQG